MSDATAQSEGTPQPRKFRRRLIPALVCWMHGGMIGLVAFLSFVFMAVEYVKHGMRDGYEGVSPDGSFYPSLKNCGGILIGAVLSVIAIEAGNSWMRKDLRRAIVLSLVFVGGMLAHQFVRQL